MYLSNLLKQKNITKYKLSRKSGVPFTTISEITTGKSNIKNCTGETLYRLAKALDVTIEDLLAESMIKRPSFEYYKSTVCHRVNDMGDLDFLLYTLGTDEIRKLYHRKWYPESLYLLAMVDYLSRENDLPVCIEYDDIRKARLSDIVYPGGIHARCLASGNENPKQDSIKAAIPEFLRHNIVESEVRNVG